MMHDEPTSDATKPRGLDLSKLKVPERPDDMSWRPPVAPQYGGASAAIAVSRGGNTAGAAQAMALNGLVRSAQGADETIAQQVVSVTQADQFCPYCRKKLARLGDGQYQCKEEGWPKKRGCNKVIDLSEDANLPCEYCGHSLVNSKQAVTRFCHNCGYEQSIGHGGLWAESTGPIEGQTVGV